MLAVSTRTVIVRPDAGWTLNLYPDAGEAGGTFVPSVRRSYRGVRGAAVDPERSRQEAGRRAAGRLRRYCAANRLNRFGTLTYGPPRCTDPAELRDHVAQFFRELRSELGGDPLPYVWVPELHKDRVHWHVHFAVQRFIHRTVIERVWGRGFIKMKLIGDLPVGSGTREESRIAARYLSKYVSKTFDNDLAGRHRYEVAQGFQPLTARITGTSAEDVAAAAIDRMNAEPIHRWNSDEVWDWKGSPALWMAWR